MASEEDGSFHLSHQQPQESYTSVSMHQHYPHQQDTPQDNPATSSTSLTLDPHEALHLYHQQQQQQQNVLLQQQHQQLLMQTQYLQGTAVPSPHYYAPIGYNFQYGTRPSPHGHVFVPREPGLQNTFAGQTSNPSSNRTQSQPRHLISPHPTTLISRSKTTQEEQYALQSAGLASLPPRPPYTENSPGGARLSNSTNTSPSIRSSTAMGHVPVTKKPFHFQHGPPDPAPTVSLISRMPPIPPLSSHDKHTSLDSIRKEYEAREKALMLRIEALGFQPATAYRIVNELEGKEETDSTQQTREEPAPILGVRLLQQLDLLTHENSQLKDAHQKQERQSRENVERVLDELKDSHKLIRALDEALTAMGQRAQKAETQCATLEQTLQAVSAAHSLPLSSSTVSPTSPTSTDARTRQKSVHGKQSNHVWRLPSGEGNDDSTKCT